MMQSQYRHTFLSTCYQLYIVFDAKLSFIWIHNSESPNLRIKDNKGFQFC